MSRVGALPRTTKALMLVIQEHRCFYCGHRLHSQKPRKTVTRELALEVRGSQREHLYPRSKGGSCGPGNIVVACLPCNQGKADRLPTEDEVERLARLFERFAERIRAGDTLVLEPQKS